MKLPQLILLCLISVSSYVTPKAQEISHWIKVSDMSFPGAILAYTADAKGRIYIVQPDKEKRVLADSKCTLSIFEKNGDVSLHRSFPSGMEIKEIGLDAYGDLLLTGTYYSTTGNDQMFVEKQTINGRPIWSHQFVLLDWYHPASQPNPANSSHKIVLSLLLLINHFQYHLTHE